MAKGNPLHQVHDPTPPRAVIEDRDRRYRLAVEGECDPYADPRLLRAMQMARAAKREKTEHADHDQ
jgi:hypothetical protein